MASWPQQRPLTHQLADLIDCELHHLGKLLWAPYGTSTPRKEYSAARAARDGPAVRLLTTGSALFKGTEGRDKGVLAWKCLDSAPHAPTFGFTKPRAAHMDAHAGHNMFMLIAIADWCSHIGRVHS